MQIDFHHATTYVVAREPGFSHDDADIIAYASQYVDDATTIPAPYTTALVPRFMTLFRRTNVVYDILPKHGICAA